MGPANIGRGRTLGMSLQSVIHKGFTLMFLSQKITKDGCGKTKSCYSEPANCKSSKDCEYLATIKPEGDQCESVEFELSTKKQWGAIGFNSEKNKMVRKINCSYWNFKLMCQGNIIVSYSNHSALSDLYVTLNSWVKVTLLFLILTTVLCQIYMSR